MDATLRWARAFIEELECVVCRTRVRLTLRYISDREVVPIEDMSVDQLKSSMNIMDTFCDQCTRKQTTKILSKERWNAKANARMIASVRIDTSIAARYDTYKSDIGTHTKQDVIEYLRRRMCASCGMSSISGVLVSKSRQKVSVHDLKTPSISLNEMLKELLGSYTLCPTCFEKSKSRELTILPEYVINENFLSSTLQL